MREIRSFPYGKPGKLRPLNTWGGVPAGCDPSTFWVLRIVVDGPVDARTGYLCDIKALDAVLYDVVEAPLAECTTSGNHLRSITTTLREVFEGAGPGAPGLPMPVVIDSLELETSPYLRFQVVRGETGMVRVTRSFEFSAAHRLYCERLSEEENLRVFGKCSNPHGHGHNYVLEVTVGGTPREVGTVVDPPLLDRVVNERVIRPFDHKNLNVECDDFSALNPSVENIARVIWGRLAGGF
ncbi:MAG: 6-carboxytetrahydropterin synthase, partial [Phycisphaerae bacterium]